MSLLYPGGYRGPTYYSGQIDTRIFGFETIRRACNQRLKDRDYSDLGRTSIATGNRHGGPHLHKREITRRQRQAASKIA